MYSSMNFDKCTYPGHPHSYRGIGHFYHPQMFICPSAILLQPPKKQCFLSLETSFGLLESYLNAVVTAYTLCVWLHLFNTLFLRFIHVVSISSSFLYFVFMYLEGERVFLVQPYTYCWRDFNDGLGLMSIFQGILAYPGETIKFFNVSIAWNEWRFLYGLRYSGKQVKALA